VAILAALVAVLVVVLGSGAPAGATLAESFARSWAGRRWVAVYADLDARSRAALRLPAFVATVRDDADLATVRSVSVGAATAVADDRFSVGVVLRTRIFGTLDERFTLDMSGPAASPRIRWSAADAFPGLLAGERLTRVDTAPARGILLARNGTPLSLVPAASNVIGTVGPAAGSLLERTVAAGFPAATAVGLDGLQYLFQRRLGGTPGGMLYAGRRLLAIAIPRAGADVRSSISPALQTLAVTELGTSVGGIVVMEPSTGEILAAAGAPLSELQPPGSTFKIITVTAVLEAHLAKPATVFDYATSTVLDDFTLHNANGESCGGTLANAFAVSCNSVFAPLGARLGASRLLAAAGAYGFNAASPLSIAAESTVPPASLTDDLQLGESAIGQSQVLASPLQMARVAATIALVGRRPVPTFAIVAPRRFPRVIPVGVARTVRALMRDVVAYGTGVGAQIPGVVVAGKTGTAEVVTPVACGPTGASGPTGATGAGDPAAAASAHAAAVAHTAAVAHASGTGGASAPADSGSTSSTGSTSATGASSGTGGASGPTGSTATSSSTSSASESSGAIGPTGPSVGSGASGATGASGCSGVDNNPYDTDAWFVAFAPEIHPRFVVAVLLPHDGAGGTTAAPLARAILVQALGVGA
jgi:transpeptidase family protein